MFDRASDRQLYCSFCATLLVVCGLSLLPGNRITRRPLRTLAAGSAALSLLVCSLGLPLPIRVQKQASEPFPCQDCPCSCETAERCWGDCCCYTPQEKLVWARRHGVVPPAALLSRLALVQSPRPQETDDCCAARRSCCSTATTPSACCQQEQCQPPQQTRVGVVLVLQELRCHGLATTATLLPPMIPAPDAATVGFDPTPTGNLGDIVELYGATSAPPDLPPPQSSDRGIST